MKKNKKKIIIIASIVIVLAILGVIFCNIDVARLKENEQPIFSINTEIIGDGGTKAYLGIGYKIIDFNTKSGFDEIKVGLWGMRYENYIDEIKAYEAELKQKEENNQSNNNNNIFYASVLKAVEDYIIVEPFDNEEIKNSYKQISINIENSTTYQEGENVRVEFEGEITNETIAKVEAKSIDKINFKDFEFIYTKNENETNQESIKYSENDKYSVSARKGDVTVKIEDETFSLKDAIQNGKITAEEIIEKAKQEAKDGKIEEENYDLEKSTIYRCNGYAIIVSEQLDEIIISSEDTKMEEIVQIIY